MEERGDAIAILGRGRGHTEKTKGAHKQKGQRRGEASTARGREGKIEKSARRILQGWKGKKLSGNPLGQETLHEGRREERERSFE